MIVRWFCEFVFKLWVSSSKYFIEYFILILSIKWNMSFSLSNAQERPQLRAASSKHGCMLTRSLEIPPDCPHQPGVQLLPSLLSAAPRVCRRPLRVCLARSVAPREPHARPYVANASRACVSDVAVLCCHPCVNWTRACVTHVFFATCTHQFTIHLVTDKPYQTHTSDGAPRAGSHE